MNTTKIGKFYEQKALNFLKTNHFEIIETNYFAKKLGEIDIIAKKEGVLHFVEVKSGNSFEPAYNITPSKLKKIINSSYLYMKHKNLDVPFCIDAIIIKNNSVEFLENITF